MQVVALILSVLYFSKSLAVGGCRGCVVGGCRGYLVGGCRGYVVGGFRGYVVCGCRGYVVGGNKIKANSAQLELELGLSLATGFRKF